MSTQNEATQAPAIAGDNQQPSPAAAPLVQSATSGSHPMRNPWDVMSAQKTRSLFLGILDVLEREFPDDLRSVKCHEAFSIEAARCPILMVHCDGWNVQAMSIVSEFAKANGERDFLPRLARVLCGLTHELVMKGGLLVDVFDDGNDTGDESVNREFYLLPSSDIVYGNKDSQAVSSDPSGPAVEPVQP